MEMTRTYKCCDITQEALKVVTITGEEKQWSSKIGSITMLQLDEDLRLFSLPSHVQKIGGLTCVE